MDPKLISALIFVLIVLPFIYAIMQITSEIDMSSEEYYKERVGGLRKEECCESVRCDRKGCTDEFNSKGCIDYSKMQMKMYFTEREGCNE